MKINPIVLFTGLTVVAATACGFLVLKSAQPPQVKTSFSDSMAPAPVAGDNPSALIQSEKISAVSNTVRLEVATKPVMPTFDTVRVEANGEAVIAGRAAPGSKVVAKLNGTAMATGQASSDGSFVLIPDKPIAAGAGILSLESDAAGEIQVSPATVAVAVKPKAAGETTVAVLTPDQPTKIMQAPAASASSVALDAVDYNDQGHLMFSGHSKPGSTVRLYVDNHVAGETRTDPSGKWSYVGKSTETPGVHNLRADELANDGSVKNRVELPFVRETPSKVAAAIEPALLTATIESPKPTVIVIQPGNNLWTLSRQIYGAGRQYTVIYEANKSQIRNPRLIYPGQIITAPVAETDKP